mgnify:FL=1|tara:strand:+ start:1008 stop:5141 length:4134 start_codon:yes stop_codon:yes gene_type:complete
MDAAVTQALTALKEQPSNKELKNSGGYSLIDGDTVINKEGKRVRIAGLNAPEITRYTQRGVQPGTPGGEAAWEVIADLANNLGYTNIELLYNKDGSPMMDDTGTRQMGEMRDARGRNFTTMATKAGINEVNRYSSNEDLEANRYKNVWDSAEWADSKPLNAWERGEIILDSAVNAETTELQRFKTEALNEKTLSQLNKPRQPGESISAYKYRLAKAEEFSYTDVQVRHSDRTLDNQSTNPLRQGVDVGFQGAIEGLYGMADMIGETTGFDFVKHYGTEGIRKQRYKLAQMPEMKLNILKPELDAYGNVIGNDWDVDGIGDVFRFLGNNMAVSLPYMTVTMGAVALAPATLGMSMLAPVSIYSGQTYNDMEGDNKSASLAVAAGVTMTVLDKLGLKGITGTFLQKGVRDQAVKALIAKNLKAGTVTTAQQARAVIAKLTRTQMASLVGDAAKVAKDQLAARVVVRGLLERAGRGAVTEGITEAGQEATQYLAAVVGSDKVFDAVDFQNRLLNATLAGTSLGATFALPGAAIDTGAWADVAVRQGPAEAKRLSKQGQRYDEELAAAKAGTYGPAQQWVPTNQDNIDLTTQKTNTIKAAKETKETQIRNLTASLSGKQSASQKRRIQTRISNLQTEVDAIKTDAWEVKVAKGRAQKKTRGKFEVLKESWERIPGLWRGAVRLIITEDVQEKSRAMRKMGDWLGANLHTLYTGGNFEQSKHHLDTQFIQSVDSPAMFAEKAGLKTVNQGELSNIINQFSQWVGNKTGVLDWSTLPEGLKKHQAWLGSYYTQVTNLSNKLHTMQTAAAAANNETSTLGYIPNYLLKYKALNKVEIEKHPERFAATLMKEYQLSKSDANIIVRNILDQETILDEKDLFSVGAGKFVPSSHKKRTLGLSENPAFDVYMENDVFTNITKASQSAARYITYNNFLGTKNEKLNSLLNEAIAEGVDEKRINRIASQLQDYLDGESGNYMRIKNPMMAKIVKNLGFWTTLAGLPLSTIASVPELAITTMGIPKHLIKKQVKNAGKEFAQSLWSILKDPRYNSTARQLDKEERQKLIKESGFYDWSVGAAQTVGATENTFASRHLMDKYFKVIGLQQYTDFTRNIVAGISDDYIRNYVDEIITSRKSGVAKTNAVQEAESSLRDIGINVDEILTYFAKDTPLNDVEMARFDAMMSEARYNLINQKIALPQVYNRPLFYQNQHLALFTQFQGFISTFTANQIPRMWGDYIKRGTPAMKYNAFAAMMTMIMLGFVSQYLKDLLKYGETSPYLDTKEKIQRGIGSSGLLGASERVINFVYPIYETSSDNMVEWTFNAISGEAAALSNVTRVYSGASRIVQGDTERGIYDWLKTVPLTAPFNNLNRDVADILVNKNKAQLFSE